ncbi:MAG: BBP7 family outer membrane beta-barrel protein [Pirellulaceae bacterium]
MPASTKSGARTISDKSGRSISDTGVGYATNSVDMSLLAPTAASFSGGGCDGGCGGCDSCGGGIISSGCDSACGAACGGAGSSMWVSAETLLWFTNGGSTPPLVTTSAQGVLPVYGANGVQTALGGPDGIDQGMFVGFRLEAGTWLDDGQKFGVSGRVFGFDTNEEYSLASDGSTSIGIPFFNTNAGVLAEDAYLVAFTAAGPTPISSGNVFVRSDLDLISADGSIRALLAGSGGNRVDLLAGYTFARVKSSLTVNTQSENLFTGDLIADGTIFDTHDLFETSNEFHGAHLGLLSTVTRKGLSLMTLAKVSFGNMRQTGRIEGFTTESFGGASSTTAGGVFAQPTNIGSLGVNNEFAFIPELGAKLAYDVNDQLKATVGYTFLYYSSVALAGEQVDHSVDLSGTGTRPTANFADGSLWTQGIDLGMIYSF